MPRILFFPSRLRAEITAVSSTLSLILASLIYYSVFNLAIWGLFPHLVTRKPLLNRHLIHYTESCTQQTTFWNWPLEGLLILPQFPPHYPPTSTYISVIVEQAFLELYSPWVQRRFTFEKHPCVCSLHKTVSIKLWRGSIQHRQSQVPIVAIPLKSFCVYDKSRPIAVGFLLGLLSRLWPPFGKTGHSDLQAPIIICNCGKVKGKARLFTAIYGSLYLMCHTSQGSIALNSLLIGKTWLCSA